jgi:hypothetical protein
MKMYSLAVGSVTNAMRGRDILDKNGIKASVTRYSGDNRLGCGYVLVVKTEPERCKKLLNSVGIKVLDVSKK